MEDYAFSSSDSDDAPPGRAEPLDEEGELDREWAWTTHRARLAEGTVRDYDRYEAEVIEVAGGSEHEHMVPIPPSGVRQTLGPSREVAGSPWVPSSRIPRCARSSQEWASGGVCGDRVGRPAVRKDLFRLIAGFEVRDVQERQERARLCPKRGAIEQEEFDRLYELAYRRGEGIIARGLLLMEGCCFREADLSALSLSRICLETTKWRATGKHPGRFKHEPSGRSYGGRCIKPVYLTTPRDLVRGSTG